MHSTSRRPTKCATSISVLPPSAPIRLRQGAPAITERARARTQGKEKILQACLYCAFALHQAHEYLWCLPVTDVGHQVRASEPDEPGEIQSQLMVLQGNLTVTRQKKWCLQADREESHRWGSCANSAENNRFGCQGNLLSLDLLLKRKTLPGSCSPFAKKPSTSTTMLTRACLLLRRSRLAFIGDQQFV